MSRIQRRLMFASAGLGLLVALLLTRFHVVAEASEAREGRRARGLSLRGERSAIPVEAGATAASAVAGSGRQSGRARGDSVHLNPSARAPPPGGRTVSSTPPPTTSVTTVSPTSTSVSTDPALSAKSTTTCTSSTTTRATTTGKNVTGRTTAGTRTTTLPPSSPDVVSRLQEDLNAYCVKEFQKLCTKEGQGSRFCDASPVARFGKGPGTSEARWRCYDRSILRSKKKSMQCVDECGNLMKCDGEHGDNTVATEPLPEFSAFVHSRKWTYCSSFQQAADAMCNFKKTNYVARYDNTRKRWMCFSPADISIEGQSFCSDNCGGPVQCAGGVTEGEIPAYTVYIIQHPDIAEAFAALHPCKHPDELCVPSSVNPPKCVKSSPLVSVQRLSDQQRALDNYCQTLMDQLCREGKQTENCYELWVARRDISQGDGEPPAWACYPASFLDFSEMSTCVDGCSNQVPCAGAPKSSPDFCVMQPELKAIAENPNFCSPFQRAANEYCQKKQGPATVARRHTKSQDWACFPADELPPPGWTGCADNCGNFSVCTGSLAEVVSAATAPGVQPDSGVATAVKSVPAPCLEGEECTATALDPPYCSHTRPNPQPKPLPEAVLREALGCGGMEPKDQSSDRLKATLRRPDRTLGDPARGRERV